MPDVVQTGQLSTPKAHITGIISSAVNIKIEFKANALPVEVIGMNLHMMCDYIKFCADHLFCALALGCR
jgi:ribonucleoside-diphosphate reductase beta chain